jgi:hypothetical protein
MVRRCAKCAKCHGDCGIEGIPSDFPPPVVYGFLARTCQSRPRRSGCMCGVFAAGWLQLASPLNPEVRSAKCSSLAAELGSSKESLHYEDSKPTHSLDALDERRTVERLHCLERYAACPHRPQMDPLSVSAAIIGVLGAAASVSSLLITFTKNTRGAPKLARNVLADVTGLSAILSQLQSFLLGTTKASKSRASLILVEQVIVSLTECVTTFSELEKILGTSTPDEDMSPLDRVKWAMKESKILDIQRRLQSNKSSLTLMLTILQW